MSRREFPSSAAGRHVARWMFRFLIGAMWWQQTLWKLPPYYTDQPDEPFGTTGLAYWMKHHGQARLDPAAGRFRQSYRSAEFLSVRAGRLCGRIVDGGVADVGAFVGLFGLIGALADPQSVAWPLQRARTNGRGPISSFSFCSSFLPCTITAAASASMRSSSAATARARASSRW